MSDASSLGAPGHARTEPPRIVAPRTRDDVVRALRQLHADSLAYWATFPDGDFLAPLGPSWSPADQVRHLTISMSAVTRGLRTARPVLFLMFGLARRPSRGYDAMRETYQARLAQGGQAGRFAPRPLDIAASPAAARADVMARHARAVDALVAACERWPERALDRYRLPHPLLGKLTVREMLCFTLYHNLHHVHVAHRRLTETATGA